MSSSAPPADPDSTQRFAVVEEDLQVLRDSTVTGAVRVRVQPRLHTQTVDATATRTEVDVERVAVDREVQTALPPWQDGDVWVVPVYEERVVLQRRLVLKEELRLRPRRHQEPGQQVVQLRRDEVHVERLGPDGRWVITSDEPSDSAAAAGEHTNPGGPAATYREP